MTRTRTPDRLGRDLLGDVLEAHGGLERWRQVETVRATIVTGGSLWAMEGLRQDAHPREMTVSAHTQHASVHPFGAPDQRTDFTPARIAVEKLDGRVVAEREDPRASFDGHGTLTPWDPLHRAYFNGYALWTYLTAPFLRALPGVDISALATRWEEGELWRGLRAVFPAHMAGHGPVQDFYFGPDDLLRRHDYQVDIAGGLPAAQYVYDFTGTGGLLFPTVRRAYRRTAMSAPVWAELLVAIDLSECTAGHRGQPLSLARVPIAGRGIEVGGTWARHGDVEASAVAVCGPQNGRPGADSRLPRTTAEPRSVVRTSARWDRFYGSDIEHVVHKSPGIQGL